MEKTRLEAFSDGVLAIIITIMVLELKLPHGTDWAAIKPIVPTLVAYVLSFVNVGIYWANHHHLMQTARRVDGAIIWANLHLLFWLSLIPIATMWMGENDFDSVPVAVYAMLLILNGIAFSILAKLIERTNPVGSELKNVFKKMRMKETISTVLNICSVPLAFVEPLISCMIFAVVALMWIIPIKEIERYFATHRAD